jgi:hypothetical protein
VVAFIHHTVNHSAKFVQPHLNCYSVYHSGTSPFHDTPSTVPELELMTVKNGYSSPDTLRRRRDKIPQPYSQYCFATVFSYHVQSASVNLPSLPSPDHRTHRRHAWHVRFPDVIETATLGNELKTDRPSRCISWATPGFIWEFVPWVRVMAFDLLPR